MAGRTRKAVKAEEVEVDDDVAEEAPTQELTVSLEPGAVNALANEAPPSPLRDFRNQARWSREGRPAPNSEVRGNPVYSAKELRNMAHQAGLIQVDVDLSYFNPEYETAIARATAYFSDGTRFQEFGDATPQNCGKGVGDHYIRMASTRAISRALTLGLNADANAAEEFGGSHGDDETPASKKSYRSKGKSSGKSSYKAKSSKAKKAESEDDGDDWD